MSDWLESELVRMYAMYERMKMELSYLEVTFQMEFILSFTLLSLNANWNLAKCSTDISVSTVDTIAY